MNSAPHYFIPVCLYPHTHYRTRAGVATLFEKYELGSHEHLIVIADRLLVLDRLVTGRYWALNSLVVKARREAEQIQKLIRGIAYKMGAQATGKIVYWDEIADTAEYATFAGRLCEEVLKDDMLAGEIEKFVYRRVKRFGLGSLPERERGHEREYVLSEMCMSVYCTEVLAFCNEVWERPPSPDAPDPLKLLYRNRPGVVARVTGHPTARSLFFLYPDRPKRFQDVSEGALAEPEPA
jgi:hypothetical protein